MDYKQRLKRPKWQKKRLEMLEKHNWRCDICDDTETCLHLHHKKYEYGRLPWEYQDGNFSVLCERCHFDVELLKLEKKHNEHLNKKLTDWYKSDEFKEISNAYKKENT